MIDTKRQRSIFDESRFEMPIMVIGAGGMGTRIGEGLTRMGLGTERNPLHFFDDDSFEEHNLCNQLMFKPQVGLPKVLALRDTLRTIEPELHIGVAALRVEEGNVKLKGIVFLCTDEMDAKADIMENSLENNPDVACVIETRMDAGVGVTFCFDPNNKAHQECWWSHFYPDDETENMAGCGGPQSIISAIYGTSMLALKQFEHFAKKRSALGMTNRVYQDFDYHQISAETWPTELDQTGFAK